MKQNMHVPLPMCRKKRSIPAANLWRFCHLDSIKKRAIIKVYKEIIAFCYIIVNKKFGVRSY